MAHTYRQLQAHASSAANPVSFSVTTQAGDTVLVLSLKIDGGTNRTGGAPSIDGISFAQANSTQKAASSPEASAELWYLLNPHRYFQPGSHTVSIPNAGTLTVFYGVDAGIAKAGSSSALDVTNGSNATGTNPSPGAVTTTADGDIGFAIVATGAQTWAPSAQVGTAINNTDDGATGTGRQYLLQSSKGASTLSWTFGTSDDYGAVVAFFQEVGPIRFNDYVGLDVGNGMSCVDKIR